MRQQIKLVTCLLISYFVQIYLSCIYLWQYWGTADLVTQFSTTQAAAWHRASAQPPFNGNSFIHQMENLLSFDMFVDLWCSNECGMKFSKYNANKCSKEIVYVKGCCRQGVSYYDNLIYILVRKFVVYKNNWHRANGAQSKCACAM